MIPWKISKSDIPVTVDPNVVSPHLDPDFIPKAKIPDTMNKTFINSKRTPLILMILSAGLDKKKNQEIEYAKVSDSIILIQALSPSLAG